MAITEQLELAPNQLTDMETLRESVDRGVELGVRTMDERFWIDKPVEERLPFHNGRHAEDVVRRSEIIASAVQEASDGDLINDRDLEVTKVIAANHDVVQKFYFVPEEFGGREITKRKRYSGQNESDTYDEIVDFMDQENDASPTGPIYTYEDKHIAEESMESTVPGWNQELGTVVQPNKDKNPSVISHIVALADLGSAGIDGEEAILKDSDLNFLEENVDAAALLDSETPIDDLTKNWLKARIVKSTESQIAFIKGRKQMLDSDLAAFPPKVAEYLKANVFTKFDESIAKIEAEYQRRNEATPDEVIASVRGSLALAA